MEEPQTQEEPEDDKIYKCFGNLYTGQFLKAFKKIYYEMPAEAKKEWLNMIWDQKIRNSFTTTLNLNTGETETHAKKTK